MRWRFPSTGAAWPLALAATLTAPALPAAQPPVAASVPLPPSLSAAGHSSAPLFSAQGRRVAFLSHAPNLVPNDDLEPHLDLFLRDLTLENTVLISVNTSGVGGGNDNVALAALSADARWVAFESAASNLAAGDTNGLSDIFLRDVTTGLTRLISINVAGAASGNGRSYNPLLSADGRYVVFESDASNLVTNDFNGTNDVFLRDVVSGVTMLVSLNADGTASADGPSHSASISSNGLFVAFVSQAANLAADATNRLGEVFVRDVIAGSNYWAVASHLAQARNATNGSYRASSPLLSADGRFVAFKTGVGAVVRFDIQMPTNVVILTNIVAGPAPHVDSLEFLDNPRLVPAPAGGLGNSPLAFTPSGRYVAFATGTNQGGSQYQTVLRADFEELATNVSVVHCCPGVMGNVDYFHTNVVPTLAVVSTNLIGLNAHTNHSTTPVMSADGDRILFLNQAAHVPNAPSDGLFRIYLRDMRTNALQLLSSNRSGTPTWIASDTAPALTPDGARVAWETSDEDLVDGDHNSAYDVFVRSPDSNSATLVSVACPERPPHTGRAIATVGPGALSGDGRRVGLLQRDSGLRILGSNRWTDSVLRDRDAGTNVLLGSGYAYTGGAPNLVPPTNHSSPPQLSADGRYVAFSMFTTLLATTNVIWRDLVGRTNRLLTVAGQESSLSADGRIVAFADLNPSTTAPWVSDQNAMSDIVLFVPNRNRFPQGSPEFGALSVRYQDMYGTANGRSINPVVSADGGWVAFRSLASDLTADLDPVPAAYELFVNRILRGPTNTEPARLKLVSYTTTASSQPTGVSFEQPLPGGAGDAAFSGDGRWLFFQAPASRTIYRHDLFNDDVFKLTHVTNNLYLTNRARLTNLTVCVNCAGPSPDLSGRFVAYESPADTNSIRQIWLRDVLTGSNELISVSLDGTNAGNRSSTGPLLSFDTRFVVFTSRADNLVANDTNRASDVFVRDRWTRTTVCLSRSFAGTGPGNHLSSHPVLSADGRTVAFQSFANDLVRGDYNNTRDVFVVSLYGNDSDADGLEDAWELAHFNTLARDGAGDFDGDGGSDAQEFRAGTNPAEQASAFRVVNVTVTNASNFQVFIFDRSTTVEWSALPGRTYRVQSKDSLSAPWMDWPGDVPAAGDTASKNEMVRLQSPPTPRRFFRVQLID